MNTYYSYVTYCDICDEKAMCKVTDSDSQKLRVCRNCYKEYPETKKGVKNG